MKSVLFDLPQDLYNMICSEWLEIKEIGMFDIAIIEKRMRLVWLDQLKSKSLKRMFIDQLDLCARNHSFINRKLESNVDCFVKWVATRRIHLIFSLMPADYFNHNDIEVPTISLVELRSRMVTTINDVQSILYNLSMIESVVATEEIYTKLTVTYYQVLIQWLLLLKLRNILILLK